MRRALGLGAAILAATVMSAPLEAQREVRLSRAERDGVRRTANPSAVIATELAFARTAQEKGQWTAFAEFATKDAVMFTPEPVNALQWLKGQKNPPAAVAWQPHRVWSSCDGSLAVTKGGWQRPDGSNGYFVTVWERQKGADYKFVLDMGEPLTEPLVEPEMLQADVSECAGPIVVRSSPGHDAGRGGIAAPTYVFSRDSEDHSMTVQVVTYEGSQSVILWLWAGGEQEQFVLVSPPGK